MTLVTCMLGMISSKIEKLIYAKILILCFLLYCLICIPAPVMASSVSSNSQEFSDKVLKVIQDNPQVLYELINDYHLSQIEKQKEERAVVLKNLKNSNEIFSNSPIKGTVDSEIILIEFSDFQCPYCAEAHKILKRFLAKHQYQVTLVYKHYPIAQIHSEAIPAASASWAAHQQNKFWEYQDFLFSHQEKLGEALYLQAAKKLKLDLIQFNQDRKSQDATNAIQKDVELAETLGISGTPFFVMNGETFSGAVQESFLEAHLTKM